MKIKKNVLVILIVLPLLTFKNNAKGQILKSIGISMGTETGLALPKFEVFRKSISDSSHYYYGMSGSIWFMFAYWGSIQGFIRYDNNWIVAEISSGAWIQPKQDLGGTNNFTGPNFNFAITPKIGINLWKISLKCGPSIILYKRYTESINVMDILNYNGLRLNFEIMYTISLFDEFKKSHNYQH